MSKKTIAIIFGGKSNEYSISLKSAAAVIDNLDLNRFAPILIGITKEGKWLKYSGNTERIRNNTWYLDSGCVPAAMSACRENSGIILLYEGEYSLIAVDAVFPVLHGKNGEDGRLQGLLELAGVPFVGCGMLASAICMDKAVAHTLIEILGIQVPKSVTLHKHEEHARRKITAAGLKFPLYIKPAKSGSSIGITKIRKEEEVESAISRALVHDDKLVIEESVDGFEVGCAILGNENLLIGKVDEIELSGDFFDYEEKYSLATSIIHTPARIDLQTSESIKQTAIQIYRTLGCRGMARVDMFVTPQNDIVFNEVNTIPGFTDSSRYPKMLAAEGLSYREIINRLIDLALSGGTIE